MKELPQQEISSTENHKSQVIENPCTQIFKFIPPKLDSLREESFLGNNESVLLKCPDYESDEFADVEDNAKDSSDNNESSDGSGLILEEQDGNFHLGERRNVDKQGNQSMKRIPKTSPGSSEISSLGDESTASPRAQSYNVGASCSHTHGHDSKNTPYPSPAKLGEKEVKFKLPKNFAVPADFNDKTSPKDNKSSRQKANPLKMKTKIGMRKDKCNVCRVRLGLCAIKCRCGGYYCAKHRYDKEHNCTFDYKSMGAEEIRKNNPRIVAEKVRKL